MLKRVQLKTRARRVATEINIAVLAGRINQALLIIGNTGAVDRMIHPLAPVGEGTHLCQPVRVIGVHEMHNAHVG